MKLTDDVASVNPNISNLNFQVNLDDPENCLHSEGIKTMPEEKGFAKYFEDGQFDVAQTYGASINNTGMGSWARYIQGRDYFMAPLTEGTDYEIVKDKDKNDVTLGAMVHEMQPLFFQPSKSDWNTFELIRAFGNRGEKVPGLNANRGCGQKVGP